MARVNRYDPMSIWDIDMGYQYGILDINEISIMVSIWNMGYRYGIWYIDMVTHHIDMVILDIDMGYLVTLRVALRPGPARQDAHHHHPPLEPPRHRPARHHERRERAPPEAHILDCYVSCARCVTGGGRTKAWGLHDLIHARAPPSLSYLTPLRFI